MKLMLELITCAWVGNILLYRENNQTNFSSKDFFAGLRQQDCKLNFHKCPKLARTLAHVFDTPDVSERYSYKLQSGLSDKFFSLPSQNLTLQVSSAGLVPCEFVKFPDMKKTCHTNHVHFCHIPKSQCVC